MSACNRALMPLRARSSPRRARNDLIEVDLLLLLPHKTTSCSSASGEFVAVAFSDRPTGHGHVLGAI